jgi:protein-S-isoprenylcysteine O-methyltransferase Ste14
MFFLGIPAFGLLFLADLNDLRFRDARLRLCFPAGAVLLAVSVGGQLDLSAAAQGAGLFAALAGCLLFTALEIQALFFAFPPSEAYAATGKKRPVCDSGVYALCRHPGFWWLTLLFFCLRPAAGFPLRSALIYSLLNLALVAFEDRAVFPAVLEGYGAYRRSTPFLIPTRRSVERCLATLKIRSGERRS